MAAEIPVPQTSRNISVLASFGCVFWTRGGSGTTPEAARPNKPSWIGVPETGQLRRLRPFPPLLRISRVGHVRGCLVEQTGQLRSFGFGFFGFVVYLHAHIGSVVAGPGR